MLILILIIFYMIYTIFDFIFFIFFHILGSAGMAEPCKLFGNCVQRHIRIRQYARIRQCAHLRPHVAFDNMFIFNGALTRILALARRGAARVLLEDTAQKDDVALAI